MAKSTDGWINRLYYGDNLGVIRENVATESIDLVYLDPPFNSKRDYNLLFKSPKGHQSEAQIEAFKDSWSWGEQAEREFDAILHQPNTDVALLVRALRAFLGENDMMAYLTMMANRLLELHRVLKPTGSLYLHCDPTASHFLKIVLDGVFGKSFMVNEIIWKRSDAHSDARQGARHYGRIHDTIFFYAKGGSPRFNSIYTPLPASTVDSWYRNIEPETGRRYNKADLTGPGGAAKGNPLYDWKGITRYWRYSRENMERLESEGRIVYSKSGMPYQKRYLDESKGVPAQDIWDDIDMLRGISSAGERLGYPTQKPLALFERIIEASSAPGDVVLDPFCGCGTAVHAAEKLGRRWIGVDITHLAISLIEKRLKDAFGGRCRFEVVGTPRDLEAARDLAARDNHQFQWWAVSLVDAQPFHGRRKGADGGIDGLKFFHDVASPGAEKIVVSVKGGALKADDVRALNHVREREGAQIGLLISLAEPTAGMRADAAAAGLYPGGAGRNFPRIQLLTIEGLLSGSHRAEHPDHAPNVNFKKAKRESPDRQTTFL